MKDRQSAPDKTAERSAARRAFLDGLGWRHAEIVALPADASFRRYYRVNGGERPALVMDAPPGLEDTRPFIAIARHLRQLGLSAPEILTADEEQGFVLIEDFGNDTFTRLLNGGAELEPLYALAVDALAALHRHPDALQSPLPSYEGEALVEAASLLPDWYLPARRCRPTEPAVREEFLSVWRQTLAGLPPIPRTMVIRDFHVDNLMLLEGRSGIAACGILDFQDARAGARPYDLMSLLQDARRDLPAGLEPAMLDRYHAAAGTQDRAGFGAWYAVLAAQRHCRILGVFVRLCVRDGKPGYLAHMPRVAGQLDAALEHPALKGLRAWFSVHVPDLLEPMPAPVPGSRIEAPQNLASPQSPA